MRSLLQLKKKRFLQPFGEKTVGLCSHRLSQNLYLYFLEFVFLLSVLQVLRPRPEEAERFLPQHWSRHQSRGGAWQHVQAAPQTQSPGDLCPAALPQEREATVDAHSLGRGRTKEEASVEEKASSLFMQHICIFNSIHLQTQKFANLIFEFSCISMIKWITINFKITTLKQKSFIQVFRPKEMNSNNIYCTHCTDSMTAQ